MLTALDIIDVYILLITYISDYYKPTITQELVSVAKKVNTAKI